MKTHPQLLITTVCIAPFLFTGAALAQTPSSSVASRMKAIVYHNYGSPDVLRLEGTPYIMRPMGVGLLKPNETRLGVDYSGTVEAVGKNVTKLKPGDEVFGG